MSELESKPLVKTAKPKTLARRVEGGSTESRRLAAAVLDVLGGERSAPQAAQALGISVPRYYALEARAVEGLMKACEPRPRGRRTSPEKELSTLKRELIRMTRERDRLLTLVRMAHRTVALPESKPKKRRGRPPNRARLAAAVLRSAPAPEATPAATETTAS